jgi:hypothetical protein
MASAVFAAAATTTARVTKQRNALERRTKSILHVPKLDGISTRNLATRRAKVFEPTVLIAQIRVNVAQDGDAECELLGSGDSEAPQTIPGVAVGNKAGSLKNLSKPLGETLEASPRQLPRKPGALRVKDANCK